MPVVSPRHRIAFFAVPKNACTTGKELIHYLERGAFFGRPGRAGESERLRSIHSLWGTTWLKSRDLAATEGMWRFAILRDPVSRLVSAWKNRVVRQRVLSPAKAGPALAASGLPPDPDFPGFVAALSGYRAISPEVTHHTDAQILFLGRDPLVFDRIYGMADIAMLRADLSARTGQDLPLPPIANATRHLPDPPIDAALRARIEAHYAEDLAVFGDYFGAAGAR